MAVRRRARLSVHLRAGLVGLRVGQMSAMISIVGIGVLVLIGWQMFVGLVRD